MILTGFFNPRYNVSFHLLASSDIVLKAVSGCGSLIIDWPTMARINPATSQYFLATSPENSGRNLLGKFMGKADRICQLYELVRARLFDPHFTARNNQPLDLTGAFVNFCDLCIAEITFER